jgi:2-polyprenyl-3-methyl-5-hydroxy-6-metoxy-1,4-benzoquinol methylase
MQPTLRPDGVIEHLALWLNLGPTPVAEAMFGMATSRVIMAGVRLGVYAALAEKPATAQGVAGVCNIHSDGARHLLECLSSLSHVIRSVRQLPDEGESVFYALSDRARRWLDPKSETYIGAFLEFNYDQWEWWSHLEEVVTTGQGFEIHEAEKEDPRWRRYIEAMFQLARLSAPEVARKLALPSAPQSLLDLGGGHGWFSAELCRRHPTLQATVLDLSGSVEIGRGIIQREGMGGRVEHCEGDFLKDDLGGPYDGVLCFQIIHHLTPEQNITLFRKVRNALKPGGILAVLDYFTPPAPNKPDAAAFLGMHFYLTSSAATYTARDLKAWARDSGFASVRKIGLRRIPIQELYACQA